MPQETYRPSSEKPKRRIDVPRQWETHPDIKPGHYMQGQQRVPLPPLRDWSSDWQEARHVPSPPEKMPGRHDERPLPPLRDWSSDWQEARRVPPPPEKMPGCHEERPLPESDTLPARWQNDAEPAKKEWPKFNQRQQISNVAKVHFQRPAERRQRTPEDGDDEEEETGSWSGSSFGGSLTIVGKSESKPDDRVRALSDSFDVIEHEGAGSGDEDGYVHVPRSSTYVGALEREKLLSKA